MTYKIDKLFGSKTRVGVLTEILMHPEKSYYLRELSRKLNIPYGMLYKEIKTLEEVGVIKKKKLGKISVIQVNKELPFLHELKMIIVKTTGISKILKSMLKKLKGVKYALIFGSFAKGEYTEEEDVVKKVADIEKIINREINYILWREKEFIKKSRSKHTLLKEIVNNLIMLIGDENEFRRIVKE